MIIYLHHISGIINDYLPSPVFLLGKYTTNQISMVYFPLTFIFFKMVQTTNQNNNHIFH